MSTVRLFKACAVLGLAVLATACTQDQPDDSPKFDAAYIASQADSGNLEPLKELHAACADEATKKGKRGEVCAVLDKVRDLRKPITAPRI